MVARTPLSPVRFVLFSFLLGTIALASLPLILKSFDSKDFGIGAAVIDEVVLDDGTTICLHAVTSGASHNIEARFLRERTVVVFETGYYSRSLAHDSYGDSNHNIVVWISRKDRDGRFLDLDWWSHSLITDVNGAEIRDSFAQRHVTPGLYDAELAQKRPFVQAVARPSTSFHNEYRQKQLIIGHSEFPKIRSQSDITIRIFDVSQKEIAKFTVPNPTPQPTAKWTASSLPTEKLVDNVTVRLNKLNAQSRRYEYEYDQERTQTVKVTPEFEFLDQDGDPRRDYLVSHVQFIDQLENVASSHDVTLSFKEPVWRMEATVSRHVAAVPSKEFIEFEEIVIPARNTTTEERLVFGNAKIEFNVHMVSGPGITNHQYPVSGSYRNSISDGGSFGTPQETPEDQQPLGGGPQSNQAPGSFAVSFSEGYQQTTLAFEGNAVMLRVDHVTLLVNQLLSLVAVDDQDREVEVMQRELRGSNFWFFNVAPDAKSIKIRALLQESETVEFFVKPPAVPKPLEEQ